MTIKLQKQKLLLLIDQLIFRSLEFLLIAIPISFVLHFASLGIIHQIKSIVGTVTIIFIFLFWLLKQLFQKRIIVEFNVASLLHCFIASLLLISSIASPVSPNGFFPWLVHYYFKGLGTIIFSFLLFFVVTNLNLNQKKVWRLFKTGSYTLFLVSLYGLYQYLQGPFDLSNEELRIRMTSTFGHVTNFAFYLAMFLPMVLAVFLRTKNFFEKTFHFVTFFLGYFCLIVTFTRGAWLGCGAAMVTFAGSLLLRKAKNILTIKNSKFQIPIWCLRFIWNLVFEFWCFIKSGFLKKKNYWTIIFVAILLAVTLSFLLRIFGRMEATVTAPTAESTSVQRIYIWKACWQAFLDRPILGWGLGNFPLVFPKYRDPYFNQDPTLWRLHWTPHNEYLKWLCEGGLVAFALYALMLVLIFKGIVKSPITPSTLLKTGNYQFSKNRSGSLVHLAIIAVLISYLVQAFFWGGSDIFFILFWLFVGLLWNLNAGQDKKIQINLSSFASVMFALFVSGALIFIYGIGRITIAQLVYPFEVYKGVNAESRQKIESLINKAIRLNPFYSRYYKGRAQRVLYSLEQGDSKDSNEFKKRIIEADQNCNRAMELEPHNLEIKLGCVEVINGLGNHEKAHQLLVQIQPLDPTNPVVYNELGRAYLGQKNLEKAEENFKKAIKLKPNYINGLANMGRYYIMTEDFAKAKEYLKKAAYYQDIYFHFEDEEIKRDISFVKIKLGEQR